MERTRFYLTNRSFITGLACLIIMVLCVNGCAPLRKKFTREKKKDKESTLGFIPVLDPVDYPEKTYSPQEYYKQYYVLWKVWIRDLLQSVQNEESDKRQKFLLGQTIEQLENMRSHLDEVKQEEFAHVVTEARRILEEYEKPAAMRSKFSTHKKIASHEQEVRHKFSPNIVFPDE